MAAKSHFFILCLTGLLFTASVIGQKAQPLAELFPSTSFQDSLYNMTPTEDGQEGFHLWVWKPSFESIMPVKKYDEYLDQDMNRNPLKQAPNQMPETDNFQQLPKMPNTLDEEFNLLPEQTPKE